VGHFGCATSSLPPEEVNNRSRGPNGLAMSFLLIFPNMGKAQYGLVVQLHLSTCCAWHLVLRCRVSVILFHSRARALHSAGRSRRPIDRAVCQYSVLPAWCNSSAKRSLSTYLYVVQPLSLCKLQLLAPPSSQAWKSNQPVHAPVCIRFV
jgi:hypothetical protein